MPDQPSGMGVDASGGPVIDPTANVIALVEAGMKRQDDLREASERHTAAIVAARAEFDRQQADHLADMANLRAEYEEKLRHAESERINAIRELDVTNVTRASEVSAAQASTLANQVSTSAEALRAQVEATRQQTATTLAAALEPIQKDVADLRRVQYEQQGQRVAQVEYKGDDSTRRGTSQWATTIAIAVVGLLVAIIVGASAIYARTGTSSTPTPIVCTSTASGVVTCTPTTR